MEMFVIKTTVIQMKGQVDGSVFTLICGVFTFQKKNQKMKVMTQLLPLASLATGRASHW